jgi:DNA-binding CsgD family transcriptional regulator
MATATLLYLGRTAFEKERWKEALTNLSEANEEQPLAPNDLECLAMAAYLIGKFKDANDNWTGAHNAFLKNGDIPGAVRCAFWLGFTLMSGGETIRGGGWIGHAQKLLEENPVDCAEQGYLLLTVALNSLRKGDTQGSLRAFDQACETGNRFADQNLRTLADLGRGQALIRMGEIQKGVNFLDEAMIAVTSGELSAIVVGIVYCAVIEASLEIFDFNRAKEWTDGLSDWCAAHPDLVPFRGQCLIRRSEIMRLNGNWTHALQEAVHAIKLLTQPAPEPAAGSAFCQLGDLYRLQGENARAEQAYTEASKLGRSPQPGLALLRLAQGQTEKAKSSISNALTETRTLKNKCEILFAGMEIMLADGSVQQARSTANELKKMAREYEVPWVHAMAAQAEGMVLLAEREPQPALASLRNAHSVWDQLNAPYEVACTRSVMARAYKEMDDEDSALMEYEAARSVFQQLKAVPDIVRLEEYFHLKKRRITNGLTRREIQVLQLIADGKTNKTIADELFISERTVERHVSNIFTKLDVASRSAATAHAYKHNLL